MKTLLILALIATVFAMLVCAWYSTAKPKHKQRFQTQCHSAVMGIQEALVLPQALWQKFKYHKVPVCYGANIAAGTHSGSIRKKADAALATRYLLGKIGSDIDHITYSAANTEPYGVITDEAAAAEDEVSMEILGISNRTLLMVASEAIAAGALVYTAANGKVQDEPAVAGTYYLVGRALIASAADGDQIEVAHCKPLKLVVVAAFTSTDGTAAAAADLAALKAEAEKIGDDVRSLGVALASASLVKVLT